MKIKKICLIICLSLIIFSIFFINYSAYAAELGNGFDYGNVPKNGTVIFSNQTNRIWNTAIFIVRVLAFLGIFIVGLRYMFASPNQKGEIKNRSVAIVIGITLVFAFTVVIDFVIKVFNELI